MQGPWLGRLLPSPLVHAACKKDEQPVGIFGSSAALLDQVGLLCQTKDKKPRRTKAIGGPGGKDFELTCPKGQVLTGLQTRTAHYFRAIGIQCRAQ